MKRNLEDFGSGGANLDSSRGHDVKRKFDIRSKNKADGLIN
jgi:hypothetical protein